jgi:hypothetical protein
MIAFSTLPVGFASGVMVAFVAGPQYVRNKLAEIKVVYEKMKIGFMLFMVLSSSLTVIKKLKVLG